MLDFLNNNGDNIHILICYKYVFIPASSCAVLAPESLWFRVFFFIGEGNVLIRVAIFVDGFNLYHAIEELKMPYLKWIDLRKLSNAFVTKQENIVFIKYFTTLANWKPEGMIRHKIYIRALELKGVETVYGKFKLRDVHCKICGKDFKKHEEKQTDVNIAISLLKTAYEDRYDKAIIITGDSDMIPAIKEVRTTFANKKVGVVIPYMKSSIELINNCDFHIRMKFLHLERNRFDDRIEISPGNFIECPEKWRVSV